MLRELKAIESTDRTRNEFQKGKPGNLTRRKRKKRPSLTSSKRDGIKKEGRHIYERKMA